MFENTKAIFFDLDGTLVDSMNLWRKIDEQFLIEKKINIDPEVLQQDIAGLSMTQTAQYFRDTFNTEETCEELMESWHNQAFNWYRDKAELKPGAKSFIEMLNMYGFKTAIVSSNSRLLVETFVNSTGIDSFIDVIITTNEVERSKPFPDAYLLAASTVGVDPKNCLVFEDIVEGIQAGNAAGMRTCAIWDDFSAYQWEDKKKEADYFVYTYKEAADLIIG